MATPKKAPVKKTAAKAEKAPKPLSARQKAFQEKHAHAVSLVKGIKCMEHNHGLYFIQTGKNEYVVGKLSATGKSFDKMFTGNHDDALEYYRSERSGNYGKDKAEKPAAKTKGKATPKPKAKKSKPVVEEDDDLEDLLD